MRRFIVILVALSILVPISFAEDDGGGFNFQAGIALGTDVLLDSSGTAVTWNSIAFQPDISIGPFGIGLDLTVHFHMMPDASTALEIFPGDWIPDYDGSGRSFLDLYLAKLMYVRYGFRGDPLYVKLGSIDDLTLGNGFIVGQYANTRFLPGNRIFGLDMGIDGQLFDFPFVGVELLTGNLARFDVVGGRFFVRPLVTTGLPILENLQVGATYAMDRNPGLYTGDTLDPVAVYGADLFLPILTGKAFPLAAFSEVAFQPNARKGFMVGAGGKLAGIINYGAQIRLLGAGFSPAYFDANYDLFRAGKAALMATEPTGEGFAGWLAKIGASVFGDMLFFEISVDGPFAQPPASPTNSAAEYPHIRGSANLAEGLLGGFYVSGAYDKYFISKTSGFFEDLVEPDDSVITAALNYKTGSAVFTLLYSLNYNPDAPNGSFDVTSSLQSSIKF
jgi:hypothetical protein